MRKTHQWFSAFARRHGSGAKMYIDAVTESKISSSMSDSASSETVSEGPERAGRDPATVEDLLSNLRDLTTDGGGDETRREVRDVQHLLSRAHERGLIDSGVRDLQVRDAAQAFIGSVIFASPLLVEDGIFDIGDYLFGSTVSGVPVFLLANTLFVVFMTYALLEWTGQNREETHLVFGVIPTRVFMILGVSFLVAALLMTVWGRVGGWQSPTEALARINVLWTVGSLGAALGDILSDSESAWATTSTPEPEETRGKQWYSATSDRANDQSRPTDGWSDGALMDAINEQFDELESTVETAQERRDVQHIREQTLQAALNDGFGSQIQKYTSRDIAEAFVGSVFFSIPFLVEDGVFDVADFFLSFQVGAFPVFFLVNTAFVLLMILALVYWAGPQEVTVSRPILGFVPRRLVGIAVVSFLTAAALMTMWGRVDNWQDPVVAIARISVVWTVASFGAALGDILPGESSGDDINDDLTTLTERLDVGGGSTDRTD
jgi:uncharacterized membrane protein